MAVPAGRWSFAAGEVTPALFGHVDFSKVQVGMSTARNGYVSIRGGFYSRAGTAFVGYSKQTGRAFPPRMVTFQFSLKQGLLLEFGNQYLRFVSDGGYVLEAPITITGATQATPCVVSTAPTAHGYSNGDWIFPQNVGGMIQLDNRQFVVAGATTTTFQLNDVFGNPVNSTTFNAFTAGGTASRIYTLPTPWAEADLPWLKWTQSADVMSICCWNQVTGTLYPSYDLERISAAAWTLTQFGAGTVIQPPASCTGTASASGVTDFQYVVTAIDHVTGQESQASPIADIEEAINIGATAGSITVTWAPVVGAGYYNGYKAEPAVAGAKVPPGALFGYAWTAFGNQYVDSNITADMSQVPPLHLDPFAPGAIEYVTVTDGSTGLTSVSYTVTTADGTGLVLIPVIIGGVLQSMIVVDPGKNYAPGDALVLDGSGFATGAIDFTASGNPSNGNTITLDGVVWTFVTSGAAGNQTNIQASRALTLAQLATDLNASANASLVLASYQALPAGAATNLTITYKTAGPAGDTYTLAASAATPSGATLTGGAGTGTLAATLVVGPTTGTYPSVISYFQERRVYASSPNNPDTYWMSEPGAFNNFDQRVPTIDSDAITGTPWSLQVDGIQWMVPMPGGLVTFTGNGAWQVGGSGSSSLNPQAITPANQQAQPQASNGANPQIPPVKINFEILFPPGVGYNVRDFSYNFFTNIYTGTDITFLSSHLFNNYAIKEWAWAEEPNKLLWATRNDGAALSLTFMKEQDVIAWTRHDTQGNFCSVAAVIEPPVYAVYFATQRFLPSGAGCYMVERMDNRIWNGVETCWCVDAGLSLPQLAPNATLFGSSAAGLGEISSITPVSPGKNYSAATAVTIVDPTGTGAIVAPTIVAGQITGYVIGGAPLGYTQPRVVIVDPAGTGAGATGTAVLNNAVDFVATLPVFGPGNVGSVIRMGGGIATITSYLSTTSVQAEITSPIVALIPNTGGLPQPAPPGAWTMTAPTATISGLWHLAGFTVTGLADGTVVTPRVVSAQGAVTLDKPASAVTLGLGFQAQFQSLYLEVGQPTVQGRRKKISAVTVRVEASSGLKGGTNQPDGSTLSPQQLAPVWTGLTVLPNPAGNLPPYGSTVLPLYTGDIRVNVLGGFAKPGQVALQQDLPLPMQVLAVIPEILEGDQVETEVQKSQPQQQGPQARR